MTAMSFASRALLAAPFVWLGFETATAPGSRVELAAELGVPRPELAVRLNGVAMVAGGVALALRPLAKVAAIGLVASMVPTTLAAHAFWKMNDPDARRIHRIQFLKNIGLVGGLLTVVAGSRKRVD